MEIIQDKRWSETKSSELIPLLIQKGSFENARENSGNRQKKRWRKEDNVVLIQMLRKKGTETAN